MKKCKNCNSKIVGRRGNAKFCSKRCNQSFFDRRRNKDRNLKRRPYVIYKKDKCEFCGFLPLHPCQLDVDHIDGNHKNNNLDNLQTLCANCHRLKTQIQIEQGMYFNSKINYY